MVLNRTKIQGRGLVYDGVPAGFRDCSYDLTVGTVIPHNGVHHESFQIPAHGIVEVVSREEIKLPTDLVAYSMVKTTLCNAGVMAISIGIIDPGYWGPISSTLINFSKVPFTLRAGTPFLRIVFHELTPSTRSSNATSTVRKERTVYVAEKQSKAACHFSTTFLDMEATAREAAHAAFGRWKDYLLFWAPVVVILLATATFVWNFMVPRRPEMSASDLDICVRAVESHLRPAGGTSSTTLRSTEPLNVGRGE